MGGEQWLGWARRVRNIAQTGLTYTVGEYDRERYLELGEIAHAMLAACSGTEPARMRTLFEPENGYPTPKVDVRGAVFRHGRILLVRGTADGLWTLPGGWADPGESPGEAVEKEIREESGFETRAVKLLAVYDRERHGVPRLPWPVYKLFVRCEITGGSARTSMETDAVEFFLEDHLPPLSEGRATRGQVARMFAHLRDPSLPADFD
jgi:ADP-ribose pyrophosphatase YjhB (NUDIX family)